MSIGYVHQVSEGQVGLDVALGYILMAVALFIVASQYKQGESFKLGWLPGMAVVGLLGTALALFRPEHADERYVAWGAVLGLLLLASIAGPWRSKSGGLLRRHPVEVGTASDGDA